jgi:2,5-furandicarboxylate decarboxylase 1
VAVTVALRDLREALEAFRERDWLLEVRDELSPRHEASALLAASSRQGGRAVLFRKLAGSRVPAVGNVAFGREAVALAMGVEASRVVETFCDRVSGLVPPGLVSEAPVLEGEMPVDLGALPILTHYANDSGPFVTAGLASARDPETGELARGIHRMEVRGPDSLAIALNNPPLAEFYRKAKARGELLPLAVVVGLEPTIFLGCALKMPPGTDKLAKGGSLRGAPVELVEAPLTGIPVPARAEFLLEGEVDPSDERPDGPLGEVSGYSQGFPSAPTFRVQRIYHRREPIYQALLPTGPEADCLLTFVAEANLVPRLRELFPFALSFYFVPETFGCSVRITIREGTARHDIRALLLHCLGLPVPKKVVALAEDVNPKDQVEVEWSVVTRSQPDQDVLIVPALRGQVIDPSCPSPFTTAKMAVDATGYERTKGWKRAALSAATEARVAEVLRKARAGDG